MNSIPSADPTSNAKPALAEQGALITLDQKPQAQSLEAWDQESKFPAAHQEAGLTQSESRAHRNYDLGRSTRGVVRAASVVGAVATGYMAHKMGMIPGTNIVPKGDPELVETTKNLTKAGLIATGAAATSFYKPGRVKRAEQKLAKHREDQEA